MKCRNCGAELTKNAQFCAACGAKTPEHEGDTFAEKKVSALGNKMQKKLLEFWNNLSLFGKTTTISTTLAASLCLIAFLAGRIFAGIISVVWLAVAIVSILMKKNVIKVPKTWISFLAVALSFFLVVPYFASFNISITTYEKYNWDSVILADMLPPPQSPYGEIISNSEDYLAINVTKYSPTQYERYIDSCKEMGFTVDAETSSSFFYAFNAQGYKLSLRYDEDSGELHITLTAATKLGVLTWPESNLAKLLPAPESSAGNILKDDEESFCAYVGNMTIDAYNAYLATCESEGFEIATNRSDKYFYAKNTEDYELTVEYLGNNVVCISLAEPKYSVSIEIECVENWIFNKYDVDVYVDDSFQETITHGDTETILLTLARGTHTLKVVSNEDSNLSGVATLHIYEGANLKYKISCQSSGIEVETIVGTTPPKDETGESTSADYNLDYADAESFEEALNSGVKVNGKIVQFVVNAYKPDSALGINCWAGEHLNFISENKLNVAAGDVVIGSISGEPSKVLGSWKIPYVVLAINDIKNNATIPSTPEETTSEDTVPPTTSTSTNTSGAPDDWTNLLETHYEEVKKQFEDAGFTNITCVAHEIDYNENNTFEGSVVNIAIGENGEICTFAKGEQWPKDIKIRIDYRVKPAKPASQYEKAFIRDMSNYDLYYMFDTDTKSVVYFGTNDTYISKGTYTGSFSTGIKIIWPHGEWTEKFTHKTGNTAVLTDGNGHEWEYKVCSVDDAQKVLDKLS